MTAITESVFPYGFASARAYPLVQSTGLVDAPDAVTMYTGLDILGNAELTINDPAPRTISGVSQNGISQIATLPPLEGMSLTLNAEAINDALTALFGGTKVVTQGEASMTGMGTNQKGNEPTVAFIAWKDCKGITTGNHYYVTYVFPKATVIENNQGMNNEKLPNVFTITPSRTGYDVQGQALAKATNGYNRSQGFRYVSENPLMLAAWVGDGTTDDFTFNTSYPGISVAKTRLVVDGAIVVPSSVSATTLTVSAAPGDGKICIALYEYPAVI